MLRSKTGAFRQAMVGTGLVRLLAPAADLSLPSTEHGAAAYSGRAVDEAAVMPVFSARRVPCSAASAYLSTLRRGKRFVDADLAGVRDRPTYQAANRLVALSQAADDATARTILSALLRGFVRLREAQGVALITVRRLSMTQLMTLTDRLLATPSGGRLPMFVVLAALGALDASFGLGWEIAAQGINAADSASGAPGDIVVSKDGAVTIAMEVTERCVDERRVRDAMNGKVMPAGVADYLYFVTTQPSPAARAIAQTYFGQGHDVNFVMIADWVPAVLALSADCRTVYAERLREQLGSDETPVALKIAWNAIVAGLF